MIDSPPSRLFSPQDDSDLREKLKWLMFLRIIFTSVLLGSTIIFHLGDSLSPLHGPLLMLYAVIGGVFILSFGYATTLPHIRNPVAMAYVQIGVDTVVVTLIIYVTGSFASIFNFLYLLVIIYSSLFIRRRGSVIMAGFCVIQYGAMIDLEFFGWIHPFVLESVLPAQYYPAGHVFYKILITAVACFAVAFLSGMLSEQVRRGRIRIEAMENHVKRVEKMAFMGKMAAFMAHEIKNPLASLAGSIQLLQEDLPRNSDQERLMQIVLRECDRLRDLVENFLLFARPAMGRMDPIQLDRAIAEIVSLFEKNLGCKGRISIMTDLTPDVWAEMDPANFRQVLWNLLMNAAEAIDETGTIGIRLFVDKHRNAVIQITDDGCGMSKETALSIFDPFFTTKPQGTGLGLSIVHRILESYGSRLNLESEVGRGTTVQIQLNRRDPPRSA